MFPAWAAFSFIPHNDLSRKRIRSDSTAHSRQNNGSLPVIRTLLHSGLRSKLEQCTRWGWLAQNRRHFLERGGSLVICSALSDPTARSRASALSQATARSLSAVLSRMPARSFVSARSIAMARSDHSVLSFALARSLETALSGRSARSTVSVLSKRAARSPISVLFRLAARSP